MSLRHNTPELKTVRSRLRATMPAPELMLWQRIRDGQFGVRFRRQHSIGRMIVDFYASSMRLAIEIDGESHFADARARDHDRQRDDLLARDGVYVLRFANHEVMRNINGVCERIVEVVRERASPSRSPSKGGGEMR